MSDVVCKSRVKVQIRDPDTDELLEERIVHNDYVVVCAGDRLHQVDAAVGYDASAEHSTDEAWRRLLTPTKP